MWKITQYWNRNSNTTRWGSIWEQQQINSLTPQEKEMLHRHPNLKTLGIWVTISNNYSHS